jgi:hypothetical protein
MDCNRPLKKRTLNIELSLVPSANMHMDAFLNAFVQVQDFVHRNTTLTTSIRAVDDPNLLDGGTLVFFFVDSINQSMLLEIFEDRTALVRFIETSTDPNVPCLVVLPDWSASSEAAFVFVNAVHHNTPEQTAACVREEAFNALGLTGDPQGDGSLFSDERWLGPELDAPAFRAFGIRDEIMMRLFYRPVFENGQSHEETLAEITQLIEQECQS